MLRRFRPTRQRRSIIDYEISDDEDPHSYESDGAVNTSGIASGDGLEPDLTEGDDDVEVERGAPTLRNFKRCNHDWSEEDGVAIDDLAGGGSVDLQHVITRRSITRITIWMVEKNGNGGDDFILKLVAEEEAPPKLSEPEKTSSFISRMMSSIAERSLAAARFLRV
ncbi:hypothetical protein C2S52_004344 [Perilla frutescens var. hirtella]|nr:hypothetical protein C2S51_011232 [Perilla frutescens var. frutescens]KAH6793867.1 hypothetical protein C2S52_004344 [Perilla frutescens var. hirtella]